MLVSIKYPFSTEKEISLNAKTQHQLKHDYSISSGSCEYGVCIIEFECSSRSRLQFQVQKPIKKGGNDSGSSVRPAITVEQTIVGQKQHQPHQQSTLNAYGISCKCSIH